MMTTEKEKAMPAYWLPSSITVRSSVNIPRNHGISGMHTAVSTRPCSAESAVPWVAATLAFYCWRAPRW